MAGLHGKNAELRISISETPTATIPLTQVGATRVWRAGASQQNWKWGRGLTTITVDAPDDSPASYEIDPDSPFVHYPAGAVWIPPQYDIGFISGVEVDATIMDLASVSAKPSCTRQFNVSIETEILDATCIGETFKSKVTGIPDWTGSLQGLYIDQSLWGLAVAGISGIVPTKVLRFRMDPLNESAYFQGTVLFPRHEMSFGFDALIEQTVDFEGNGPLQAIDSAGDPIFPNIS